MAHRPKPSELPNIVEGLKALRKLHLRALGESQLPAADEMLYPENYPYVADFLSYVAIGARSVENQQHRLTVSGFDVAAGMKNPTSGDVEVMLNSVQAAQSPHVFAYNGWEVATQGNPLAHGILRGAVNHYGVAIPNYHYEDLVRAAEAYRKRSLAHPAVVVDTNHANSNKSFDEQPRICLEVMQSRRHSSVVRKLVKGLMVESYLVEGAQDERGEVYGKSITDPCLGWDASERLILELAELA
jgi:3-deoxy-7-phosphoheptulonate synthase